MPLLVLFAFLALVGAAADNREPSLQPGGAQDTYIVMLDRAVGHPDRVAHEQAAAHGASLEHVYGAAIEGYSARMGSSAAAAIAADPRVVHVQQDSSLVEFGEPTSMLSRTFAPSNANFDIDGVDDARVDANLAVLDTPVVDSPGLNIAGKADCLQAGSPPSVGCIPYTVDPPEPQNLHGTGVAKRAAGVDGFRAGTAPGARVFGVLTEVSPTMDSLIAAVDWVTGTRLDSTPDNDIEVANMSLGCYEKWHGTGEDPYPPEAQCDPTILDAALSTSASAGVVYVAAAGNKLVPTDPGDAARITPANHPDVIAVSNMADFDGLPGALAEPSVDCGSVEARDDILDPDSFSGLVVDLAAPTPCGGTSGSTAQVSGAAAVLASQCKPESREDVRFIADTLMAEGNFEWTDDSGDGRKEPLLDLGDEGVFDPVMVGEAPPPDGCRWRSRLARADVSGDGRADLVALGYGDGDSSAVPQVFAGELSGIDASSPSLSTAVDPALRDGAGLYAVDSADVTGDGRADLIGWWAEGGVVVQPGEVGPGDGATFGPSIESLAGETTALAGSGTFEPIAVADVTGDGRADLVSTGPHGGASAFYVSPGRADGTFGGAGEGRQVSLSGQLDSALADRRGQYFLDAVDVTGDGRADVVAMDTDGIVEVFAALAGGVFAPAALATSIDPIMDDGKGQEPVGLGDLTFDGRADLVTLDGTSLKLYEARSDGTFAAPIQPYGGAVDSSLRDGIGESLVGLLDFSRDGLADLVAVTDAGEVLTYVTGRDGTFATPVVHEGFLPPLRGAGTGYELVTQKPFVRRAGCVMNGCQWPPPPPQQASPSAIESASGSLGASAPSKSPPFIVSRCYKSQKSSTKRNDRALTSNRICRCPRRAHRPRHGRGVRRCRRRDLERRRRHDRRDHRLSSGRRKHDG